VLEELASAGVAATFFVEALNAELYPDELREISGAGHEVAYHAWRHEDWGALEPAEEETNLGRGTEALRAIGLAPTGFRPPGGRLNEATLTLLQENGFGYCSPAGAGAGIDTIVLLPFAWPAVDAFHVLPAFAALRRHLTGSEEPGGTGAVRASFTAAVDEALATGGHASLVLHTAMIELEFDAVREILARVSLDAAEGRLWAARADEAADWIASRPADFTDPPVIDRVSWMNPSPAERATS
jgi:peptidoglycan/xylan/chitin deacetylase (PgdA/CDA1 family)